MLASLVINISFSAYVFMEYIANTICHFHEYKFGSKLCTTKPRNKFPTFMLVLMCIYRSSYIMFWDGYNRKHSISDNPVDKNILFTTITEKYFRYLC